MPRGVRARAGRSPPLLVDRGDERQHQVRGPEPSRASSRSRGRAPPHASRFGLGRAGRGANAEGLSASVAAAASSSIAEMTVSIRNVAEASGRLADLVTSDLSSITSDSVVREIGATRTAGTSSRGSCARDERGGLVPCGAPGGHARDPRRGRPGGDGAAAALEGAQPRDRGHPRGDQRVNDQTNLPGAQRRDPRARRPASTRGFAVVAEEIRELSGADGGLDEGDHGAHRERPEGDDRRGRGDATRHASPSRRGCGAVDELAAAIRRAAEDSEKASGGLPGIASGTPSSTRDPADHVVVPERQRDVAGDRPRHREQSAAARRS